MGIISGLIITNVANAEKSNALDIDESYDRYIERFEVTANDKEFNGHTIHKHVSKTEQDLIKRLREVETLKAASSFPDIECANKAIKLTLRRNAQKVQHWLHNRGDKKSIRIHATLDFQTGIVVYKYKELAIKTQSLVVVLARTGENGFFVLTAFPALSQHTSLNLNYKTN